MHPNFKKNWHSLKIEETLKILDSKKDGLSLEEAQKRLKQFGLNKIPSEKPASALSLFIHQFYNPLLIILSIAIIISFFLEHYLDALFILVVIFLNSIVSFYQEYKANRALEFLKKSLRYQTIVIRDGHKKMVDIEEVVVGDIVFLEKGYKVPADGRLIESHHLRINESALTGEWLAVEKDHNLILEENTSLADRKNMVFMGTVVEEGWGLMVTVATGLETEFGQIVKVIKETEERKTPLQKEILRLSRLVGTIIIFIIVIIFIEGIIKGYNFADIFVASLALTVSAIPEGLLPLITVILILGMKKILFNKGLVKKLSATEALGSTTVVCTDKTGTLTTGEMIVNEVWSFTNQNKLFVLEIGLLTTEAFIENKEKDLKNWIIRGRPTDKALLLGGISAGLNPDDLENKFVLEDRLFFTSDNKYSATLRKNEDKYILFVIGAPEEIFLRSKYIYLEKGKVEDINEKYQEQINIAIKDFTSRGLRLIGCGYKTFDNPPSYRDLSELVQDIIFVGLISLKDPLRDDIGEVIQKTVEAGIRPVIVTGDHTLTAKAIAQEIGLNFQPENIIEGGELDKVSDKELTDKIRKISIFTRVSPQHKLKIVQAYQYHNEIVAMVGDGINDAPALKAADIGVALGSGTDIAKEASDIILLENSFKTILKAIEIGRNIFDNIRKVFIYLISDDFSELFIFFINFLLGLPLPLLPAHILWINLVEDTFPAIGLTQELPEENVMKRPPRNPKEGIVNKPIRDFMIIVFFVTGIFAFISFSVTYFLTYNIDKARNILFALMCLDSIIYSFNLRSFNKKTFRKDMFSNKALTAGAGISFILLLSALYIPFFQNILKTSPLHWIEWVFIFSLSIIEMFVLDYFKIKFIGVKNKLK